MRWATVVNAASNGQDDDGTSAHVGTIGEVNAQAGAVQIDVTVRTGDLHETFGPGLHTPATPRGKPAIEMTRAFMNGMSAPGLKTLRDAKRHLGTAAMQRVVNVTLIEDRTVQNLIGSHTDGTTPSFIGSFDVGPDGQIDLSIASVVDLAKACNGKQSTWDLGDAYDGSSHAKALQGAQAILAALGTTADIVGP